MPPRFFCISGSFSIKARISSNCSPVRPMVNSPGGSRARFHADGVRHFRLNPSVFGPLRSEISRLPGGKRRRGERRIFVSRFHASKTHARRGVGQRRSAVTFGAGKIIGAVRLAPSFEHHAAFVPRARLKCLRGPGGIDRHSPRRGFGVGSVIEVVRAPLRRIARHLEHALRRRARRIPIDWYRVMVLDREIRSRLIGRLIAPRIFAPLCAGDAARLDDNRPARA